MRVKVEHFKDYDKEIKFCQDLLSGIDGKDILLLGGTEFVNDILRTNQDNIISIEDEENIKDDKINKYINKRRNKKNKKSNESNKYLYALVEEDAIKELEHYKDKIEVMAYVLHNDAENHTLGFFDDIKQDNSCENCKGCNQCDVNNSFDEEVDKALDQYMDVLNYIDPDDYESKKNLLFELANSFYNVGSIMTKTQMIEDLSNSIQEDVERI